ncbi:DNA recombination protein RmuC [Thalassotalea profundi]|uniref:DNA recombination protein RmuC n=1 Tax=Thalassotalea profundi TaxID=2036687 RepID=A0ABQ3J7Z5_9GAMM|nr:DNA recombination protein RmuC [Thalassotalea profundi]GHF02086.1 DNA recombination protein RmuC [Thalassotalea profundi]
MTDLLIQTFIFSAVLIASLLVGIRFFKNQQNNSSLKQCEELILKNTELQTSNNSLQQSISSLKEELAAANSTISHLNSIEVKFSELQQTCSNQLEYIANNKAEISKLSTQIDEKTLQLQRTSNALDKANTDITQMQKHLQSLSNEKAEQAEKLNYFEEVKAEFASTKAELTQVREKNRIISNENAEQSEKLNQLGELKQELTSLKETLAYRLNEVSELKSQLSADDEAKKALQDKIILLETAEKRLVTQFENTANKIFKEKTGEMSAQNKSSLDSLLSPLKNQIGDFSKQVNDVYTNEAKERYALKQEVHSLKALNEKMSKEATALTRALKGDNKKQGTWGEVVLERVLQESGLRLNHEYDTQLALKDEEGSLFKPDVIVHLPGDKDVVIDSKMALTAYERYFNAEDDVIRQQALKEHIIAIKNHIKQLTSKNYHDLYGIKSLDYTLMFIPVEPAFNVAIEHDNELIQLALEKNIMLVSPTNLMVALKTINNMWRVEYQNQNAQDIANKAGAIYDKLVNFVDDMKKLGNHLQRAESSYGDAMKKLSEGRGNLIRKAEDMKSLRISNNKLLPSDLVEKSEITSMVANGYCS